MMISNSKLLLQGILTIQKGKINEFNKNLFLLLCLDLNRHLGIWAERLNDSESLGGNITHNRNVFDSKVQPQS